MEPREAAKLSGSSSDVALVRSSVGMTVYGELMRRTRSMVVGADVHTRARRTEVVLSRKEDHLKVRLSASRHTWSCPEGSNDPTIELDVCVQFVKSGSELHCELNTWINQPDASRRSNRDWHSHPQFP